MPVQTIAFSLDAAGTNPANLVIGEVISLTPGLSARAAAPMHGAFFATTIVVHDNLTNALLTRGVDYQCVELLQDATLKFGQEICLLILVINPNISASIRVDYQVLGGAFQSPAGQMVALYETVIKDNRPIDWVNILNKPLDYNPALHQHLLSDVYGFEAVVTALERVRNAIILSDVPAFESLAQWCMDQINVVKSSVNLVENLPVVTPAQITAGLPTHTYMTQDRMLVVTDPLTAHASDTNNPHNTTSTQLGLGAIENLSVVTVADIQLGAPVHKYVTHDMLLRINANQPPQLSGVSFINLNTIGATAQVSITAVNGFNSPTAVVTFYYRDVAGLGAWLVSTTIPFKNTQLTYQTVLTGLVSGVVYGVYVTITDPANLPLLVQSLESQFTTYGLAVDADSSFNIVGATFVPANLDVVDAEIISFTATATADSATVASPEVVQQVGQLDFIKLVPTASFKPEEILIDPSSVLPALHVTSQESNLFIGNDIYTVDANNTLTESVISTIVTEGEYPIINLNTTNCHAPWSSNQWMIGLNSDLAGWVPDTPMPLGRYGSVVCTTSAWVYVIGGNTGPGGTIAPTPTNAVYKAPINADGTIGAWVVDPTLACPTDILAATSYMVGNTFYIVGGVTVGAVTTTYKSVIDSNGNLGAWAVDVPYPVQIVYGAALVTKSKVYIVGSALTKVGGVTNASYSRTIDADGILGAWVVDNPYLVPLKYTSGFMTDTTAYVIGGIDGAGASNIVGRSTIDANGNLGKWVYDIGLPSPVQSPRIVSTKTHVWVYGLNVTDNVSYHASINLDGTLGPWVVSTPISPIAFTEGVVFQTSTRLYMVAGASGSATSTPLVYSTPWDGWVIGNSAIVRQSTSAMPTLTQRYDNISSNGNPHHTTTSTDLAWVLDAPLPQVQIHSCVVRTTTHAYVLGGHSGGVAGSTWVHSAVINPDGTLGAWVNTGNALPYAVTGATVVVIKNVIYVMGGYSNGGVVASVIRLTIDPITGIITTIALAPNSLVTASYYASTFITRDRVYVLGGMDNAGVGIATVQYAPILDNGDLGTWVLDAPLPGIYGLGAAVVTSTRAYLMGGGINAGGGKSNTIYVTTLLEDGSIGPWSISTPGPAVRFSVQIAYTGNRVWWLGGYNNTGATVLDTTTWTTVINPDGTLGAWVPSLALAGSQTAGQVLVTSSRIYLLSSNVTNGTTYTWSTQVQSASFNGWNLADTLNVKSSGLVSVNKNTIAGNLDSSHNYNRHHSTKTTSLATAFTAGFALPDGIQRANGFSTSTRAYLVGGIALSTNTPTANIYHSVINSITGSLGPWVLNTVKLPIPLYGGSMFKTNGWIWYVGGATTADVVQNTAYRAPIYADGTIGAWVNYGLLGDQHVNSTAIVHGNRVHLMGSFLSKLAVASISPNIWTAIIQPNGDLSAWTNTYTMPATIQMPTVFATASRIYVVGGTYANNGGGAIHTSHSAPIDANGIIGTWVLDANVPGIGTYESHQVVVTKNRVWLLGGMSGSTASTYVENHTTRSAPIDANGVVGAWVVDPVIIPVNGGAGVVFVTNYYIYMVGGIKPITMNPLTYSSIPDTYYAPFDGWSQTNYGYSVAIPKVTNYLGADTAQRIDTSTTNTTLAGWITDTPMPSALGLGGVVTTTSRVYKIGGHDALGNIVSTVYSAPIDANGVIGTWVLDVPLPGPLGGHTVIKTKSRVFTVGGSNLKSTNTGTTCYTASIDADGILGPWTNYKYELPYSKLACGVIVVKSRVWCIAGTSGSGLNTVHSCGIDASGDLGPWVAEANFPINLYHPTCIATSRYVYIMGGNSGLGLVSAVYAAKIMQDGSLGPWVQSVDSLAVAVDVSGCVVTKNRVWLLGGYASTGPTNLVQTAPIDANGVIGVWTTDSTLPGAFAYPSTVVTSSKVYLLSGDPTTGNATNMQPTVYSTTFNGWVNQNYATRVSHVLNTVVPLVGALPKKAFKGGQLLQGYISASASTGLLITPLLTTNTISTSGVVTQVAAPINGVGRYSRVSLTLNNHDIASQIKGDLWHG